MKTQRASQTAEFMALFRALETTRPPRDRLFADPSAHLFLRPGLCRLVAAARVGPVRAGLCWLIDRLWPGARAAGVARTRLIDERVVQALRDGVRQLVILGVGFDSRARRLAAVAEARVFEVDHPGTLAERRRLLARAGLAGPPHVASVAIDFRSGSLREGLREVGFEPSQRTFFVWEGVTNYLTPEAVDGVLAFVRGCAAGSQIVFTYVHRGALERPHEFRDRGLLDRTLQRLGEPWTFGFEPAELAEVLAARGLVLLEDLGSREYRARYLGARGRHLRGYAFYRAAVASVPESRTRSSPRSARGRCGDAASARGEPTPSGVGSIAEPKA